jgi:hypothetical protein
VFLVVASVAPASRPLAATLPALPALPPLLASSRMHLLVLLLPLPLPGVIGLSFRRRRLTNRRRRP